MRTLSNLAFSLFINDPTMSNNSTAEAAMAAAVAAAAELAMTGTVNLFQNTTEMVPPSSALGIFAPKACHSEKANNDTSPTVKKKDFDKSSDSAVGDDDEEQDAEHRLSRNRQRNREHARRTRLRKKKHLEELQSKVKGLEEESKALKQSIEECSVASILLGFSSKEQQEMTDRLLDVSKSTRQADTMKVSLCVTGKRKRFVAENDNDIEEKTDQQQLKLNIDGQVTMIGGGKTHINWKSGVYCDDTGNQRQLTQEQLESLR
jgi:hypothetical protein